MKSHVELMNLAFAVLESLPDQIAFDARRYPWCREPLDASLFTARGISLRRTGPTTATLHVVNHGGRESIEVFAIDFSPPEPHLSWRGCLPGWKTVFSC